MVFFSFFPARPFQVSVPSPAGGARQFVSFLLFFFIFTLSICLFVTSFFVPFVLYYFIGCVSRASCACRACRIQYDEHGIALPTPINTYFSQKYWGHKNSNLINSNHLVWTGKRPIEQTEISLFVGKICNTKIYIFFSFATRKPRYRVYKTFIRWNNTVFL